MNDIIKMTDAANGKIKVKEDIVQIDKIKYKMVREIKTSKTPLQPMDFYSLVRKYYGTYPDSIQEIIFTKVNETYGVKKTDIQKALEDDIVYLKIFMNMQELEKAGKIIHPKNNETEIKTEKKKLSLEEAAQRYIELREVEKHYLGFKASDVYIPRNYSNDIKINKDKLLKLYENLKLVKEVDSQNTELIKEIQADIERRKNAIKNESEKQKDYDAFWEIVRRLEKKSN